MPDKLKENTFDHSRSAQKRFSSTFNNRKQNESTKTFTSGITVRSKSANACCANRTGNIASGAGSDAKPQTSAQITSTQLDKTDYHSRKQVGGIVTSGRTFSFALSQFSPPVVMQSNVTLPYLKDNPRVQSCSAHLYRNHARETKKNQPIGNIARFTKVVNIDQERDTKRVQLKRSCNGYAQNRTTAKNCNSGKGNRFCRNIFTQENVQRRENVQPSFSESGVKQPKLYLDCNSSLPENRTNTPLSSSFNNVSDSRSNLISKHIVDADVEINGHTAGSLFTSSTDLTIYNDNPEIYFDYDTDILSQNLLNAKKLFSNTFSRLRLQNLDIGKRLSTSCILQMADECSVQGDCRHPSDKELAEKMPVNATPERLDSDRGRFSGIKTAESKPLDSNSIAALRKYSDITPTFSKHTIKHCPSDKISIDVTGVCKAMDITSSMTPLRHYSGLTSISKCAKDSRRIRFSQTSYVRFYEPDRPIASNIVRHE